MSQQPFDMAHYQQQQEEFRAIAISEQFMTEDGEIEIHDHVSRLTIDVSLTATNIIKDFLEDSDNPLVLSQDPVLIKKKSSEVNVLIGFYAVKTEVTLGPVIADAEVLDLNRIVDVMSDAHYFATKENNKKRWRFLGSECLGSRAGQTTQSVTAAGANMFRGVVVRGAPMIAFPTVRLLRPGETHKEQIEYDGSLWASAPVVAANFNIKRVARLFVARK